MNTLILYYKMNIKLYDLIFLPLLIIYGCNSNFKDNEKANNLSETVESKINEAFISEKPLNKDTLFYGFTSDMTVLEAQERLNYLVEDDVNFTIYSEYFETNDWQTGKQNYYKEDFPCFRMLFKGEPFLFKVSINNNYYLIGDIPNIIGRSYKEDSLSYVQMLSLHYSDFEKNPIDHVLELYRKVYGNYNIKYERKYEYSFVYSLPRCDGKSPEPPSLSDRVGIENWKIYQWPSNPQIRIIYKNVRVLKDDFKYNKYKRKSPFTVHEVDILYFSKILLENIKLTEDLIKNQKKEEKDKKNQLEESLKDII